MRFKVVRTTPLRNNPKEEEIFKQKGIDYFKKNCTTEEALIETLQDADAVISVFEPFTRKVIKTLGKMRVISQIGIGLDRVDLNAATEQGIIVTHEPDYCLEEVSDHAMALVLACGRKLLQVDAAVKKGGWGPEIREK